MKKKVLFYLYSIFYRSRIVGVWISNKGSKKMSGWEKEEY